MKYNWNTRKSTGTVCFMGLDNCIQCVINTQNKFWKLFIILESVLMSLSGCFSLSPEATTYNFLVTQIRLPCSYNSYKWNNIKCVYLCSVSFTQWNTDEFKLWVSVLLFLSSFWVAFHCLHKPQCVYPFSSWHTFSCYQFGANKNVWSFLYKSSAEVCFHFSLPNTEEWNSRVMG